MQSSFVYLLCSRPASVNWTPSGPVTRNASRWCLAVPLADLDARRDQLVKAGYRVERIHPEVAEAVSL